ncbi:hypothetical protein ACFSQ7_40920 [Paenibacillus rhizoplanae]
MTGKILQKHAFFSGDYLRKKGIAEGLYQDIYCLEEPAGFHHSWLDYRQTALPKLQAFAANVKDKSIVNEDYIKHCLDDKKSCTILIPSCMWIMKKIVFLAALQDVQTADLLY